MIVWFVTNHNKELLFLCYTQVGKWEDFVPSWQAWLLLITIQLEKKGTESKSHHIHMISNGVWEIFILFLTSVTLLKFAFPPSKE